jgi:DNA-binding transcriptional MerR regulator
MNAGRSEDLITIGAFARLGGVSIKAVRLYSNLGLLRPVVKSESRYRLFSKTQLSALHRILLLKSLGLPLAQIGRELSRLSEQDLAAARDRLNARSEEIQRQLAWVDHEIQAERAGAPVAYARLSGVVTKRLPPVRVSSRRARLDSYDQADIILRELGEHLPESARLVAGAIWHDCGARTKTIDCEAFWALRRDPRGAVSKELASVFVASILHEGSESTIGLSYETARRWIVDNRFTIVGPNREIYLRSAGVEHGDALTEIQFPVARRT